MLNTVKGILYLSMAQFIQQKATDKNINSSLWTFVITVLSNVDKATDTTIYSHKMSVLDICHCVDNYQKVKGNQ